MLLAAATTVRSVGECAALAGVAAGASLVGQTGGYLDRAAVGGRIQYELGRAGGSASLNWERARGGAARGKGRALGSRFLAVAHSLVPVLAGTLRMPRRRFARYTALGAVAASSTSVWERGVGGAGGSRRTVGPTVTGAFVAVVVVALGVRAISQAPVPRSRSREGEDTEQRV